MKIRKYSKLAAKIGAVFALLLMFMPYLAFAIETGTGPGSGQEAPNIRNVFQEARNESGYEEETAAQFFGRIVKWIIGLIGIILVLLFIYGGVVYATSAGNEDRIETGKKIMMYAIIGVVIIAIAFIASGYIIDALFPEPGTV